MKQRLKESLGNFFVRLGLGLALTGLVVWMAGPAEIVARLARMDILYLSIAAGSFLLMIVAEGARLRVCLGRFDVTGRVAAYLAVAGYFFANLMPGNLGAEAYRVMYLGARGHGLTRPTAILAFGKIVGLFSIVAPAVAYVAVKPELLKGEVSLDLSVRPWMVVLVVLGLAVLIPVTLKMLPRLRHRVRRIYRESLAVIRTVGAAEISLLILIAFLTQGLRIATIWWLVSAFGDSISFGQLLVVAAFTVFSMFIPVGFGGLGIREGVLAGGLVFFDVAAGVAVSAALMNRLFLLAAALVGGIAWSLHGHRVAEQPYKDNVSVK